MARDCASEEGTDDSAMPRLIGFEISLCCPHNGSTQPRSAETIPHSSKSPIQALGFSSVGLCLACFPLLISKQIFGHLAALSSGQQSERSAERAKLTLTVHPRTLGTPFRHGSHHLAKRSSPSAWRARQRAWSLLNIAQELSKHLQPV